MWLCVLQLLLLLSTSKWTCATPEEAYASIPVTDADDPKDGSMIVFLEGRSIFGNNDHQKSNDIEARRRSTFEKNFMRFGRSRSVPKDNIPEEEEFADDLDRAARSQNKNDNFIRFGRGSDFIRFGRGPYKYVRRSDPEKENNFIRFGRSAADGPHKRSRRSTIEDKRSSGNNIVRFGRNDNFMRFGRGENEENPDGVADGKTNENGSRQSNLSFATHLRLHDPTLLHLLTEIAAKMKAERSNWMRLGN